VADEDEGWWIDNSFRRIRVLPWFLKEGTNELVLTTLYDQTHGLEALYFTGEFGFKWRGTTPMVTALPTRLALGNWVTKGFACYTGAITYATSFNNPAGKKERVIVEVPEWEGVVMKIRVNGMEAGIVAWPPYEVDITDALADGRNRLEIEIVSSRRNLLGPLHLKEKLPGWTGSGQFVAGGEDVTAKYVSLPYGLMAPPVLSIRT
jgi:hypothetical protein